MTDNMSGEQSNSCQVPMHRPVPTRRGSDRFRVYVEAEEDAMSGEENDTPPATFGGGVLMAPGADIADAAGPRQAAHLQHHRSV